MYTWQSLSLMHVSNDFIIGQILLWMAAQTTNITSHENTMHTPCTHIHMHTVHTVQRFNHQLPTTETTLVRNVTLYCTAHVHPWISTQRMVNQTSVCAFLPSLVDANCMHLAAMTLQGSVQPKPFPFATKYAYIFPSVIQYKLPSRSRNI